MLRTIARTFVVAMLIGMVILFAGCAASESVQSANPEPADAEYSSGLAIPADVMSRISELSAHYRPDNPYPWLYKAGVHARLAGRNTVVSYGRMPYFIQPLPDAGETGIVSLDLKYPAGLIVLEKHVMLHGNCITVQDGYQSAEVCTDIKGFSGNGVIFADIRAYIPEDPEPGFSPVVPDAEATAAMFRAESLIDIVPGDIIDISANGGSYRFGYSATRGLESDFGLECDALGDTVATCDGILLFSVVSASSGEPGAKLKIRSGYPGVLFR